MRYQGGKRRSAKYIVPFLGRLKAAAPVPDVADLFLGSCGIERAAHDAGVTVTLGAEICPAMIACYRAVAAGWDPPSRLTRDEYRALQKIHGPDSQDPIAAFALAFCAYGGKWGSGHLPDDTRCGQRDSAFAAAKARKDLLEMAPLFRAMRLECMDYRAAAELVPDGGVLYLDPPWRGTLPYKQAPPFDHDAFWEWATIASLRWRVLISESPLGPPTDAGWRLAWSRTVANPGLATGKVECLWYHEAGLAARVLDSTSQVCHTSAAPGARPEE